MAANRVALILGSGPRVGQSVAERFAKDGYKVAIASRSGDGTKNKSGFLALKADLTKPDTVPAVFEGVKKELGSFPSVVVYNAAALTPPPEEDMFSISADTFSKDLNINTLSPYIAAQQAVKGWETLSADTKKTFIYTGNGLNTMVPPVPMMTTLGVGKSASAYWVGVADQTHSKAGHRFFYADERFADGQTKGQKLDGPGHAEFYAQLSDHPADIPWLATFVTDQGYTKF